MAHFGLAFSKFALLEASLQNLFCVWTLDRLLMCAPLPDKAVGQSVADDCERKALAAAFGTLLRLLRDCAQIQSLHDRLARLKHQRDYFAHRFFRDENRNMWTAERPMLLIREMAVLQQELHAAEREVDEVALSMMRRWKPGADLDAELTELGAALKRADIDSGDVSVGWTHRDGTAKPA